jgi:hypothetical protein
MGASPQDDKHHPHMFDETTAKSALHAHPTAGIFGITKNLKRGSGISTTRENCPKKKV